MSYRVDPDNNLKMIPKTKVIKDGYGHASTPAPYPARATRPTYVLINKVGNYSFLHPNNKIHFLQKLEL